MSETRHVHIDGYRVAYRVAGHGPALVALSNNRYPRAGQPLPHEGALLRLLSDRWQVFQIDPLGFGHSQRPTDHPPIRIHRQVCAVLDQHAVDRFVIWGVSQCGAMAAAVAQATPRAAAMVCGSYGEIDKPPTSYLRGLARMDRRQLGTPASRAFWHDFRRFDWLDELAAMDCPRLLYFGADDRSHAPGLRRARERLKDYEVDFIELPGAGHVISYELVLPLVVEWVARKVGSAW